MTHSASRSCINSVAHALIENVVDADWHDLRCALEVARIAIEACDMYRLFYGWPEVGEGIQWTM
jgi:hypothetical protein